MQSLYKQICSLSTKKSYHLSCSKFMYIYNLLNLMCVGVGGGWCGSFNGVHCGRGMWGGGPEVGGCVRVLLNVVAAMQCNDGAFFCFCIFGHIVGVLVGLYVCMSGFSFFFFFLSLFLFAQNITPIVKFFSFFF